MKEAVKLVVILVLAILLMASVSFAFALPDVSRDAVAVVVDIDVVVIHCCETEELVFEPINRGVIQLSGDTYLISGELMFDLSAILQAADFSPTQFPRDIRRGVIFHPLFRALHDKGKGPLVVLVVRGSIGHFAHASAAVFRAVDPHGNVVASAQGRLVLTGDGKGRSLAGKPPVTQVVPHARTASAIGDRRRTAVGCIGRSGVVSGFHGVNFLLL